MGSYDYLNNVPEGYDDQVKCWNCAFGSFGIGDKVPSVDGESSYSIRLRAFEDKAPLFIHIESCVLTKIGEKAPLAGAPVFSKWGGPEDQENPLSVAMRELKEELGLNARNRTDDG